MHDDIKRFSQEGYTDNNAKNREWCIRELETQMRDEGYVPCIDLDAQYTTEFVSDKECFWFELSVYGIYVGGKSWDVSGMANGKTIMKHTRPTKSSQS